MTSRPNYFDADLAVLILPKATPEEQLSLTKIFSPEANKSLGPQELANAICRGGGHGFANLLRGHGVAYTELVFDTAKLLKIESIASINDYTSHGVSIREMDARFFHPNLDTGNQILWTKDLDEYINKTEVSILTKIASEIYSGMSAEQKRMVDVKIQEITRGLPGQSLRGLSTASALVVLGNLGGFATYTLMSTIISSITLGTVGFGAYTFASSALSILLGPVGIAGIGVAAMYKFAGPDQRKSLQAVASIAMLRQRLTAQGALSF